VKSDREDFELWFSGGKLDCRSIERDGDGYRLMAAHQAWQVWKAARAGTEEMERALKVIYTWAGIDGALVAGHVRDLAGRALRISSNADMTGHAPEGD
jgi:hypothetical protein